MLSVQSMYVQYDDMMMMMMIHDTCSIFTVYVCTYVRTYVRNIFLKDIYTYNTDTRY